MLKIKLINQRFPSTKDLDDDCIFCNGFCNTIPVTKINQEVFEMSKNDYNQNSQNDKQQDKSSNSNSQNSQNNQKNNSKNSSGSNAQDNQKNNY